MSKIYVLDTSVLLHDPTAIFGFTDNEVVIPAVVIEEIDGKKRYQDEIGRNARQISRVLDRLRERSPLHKGVNLDNGGKLRIELNHRFSNSFESYFHDTSNDNRILNVAYNLFLEEKMNGGRAVIVVSKDAIMRIKADALGIMTQDYLNDKVVQEGELFTGCSSLQVSPEVIDNFYKNNELSLAEINPTLKLHANEYILLKDLAGSSKSAVGIYDSSIASLKLFRTPTEYLWGIAPRSIEQKVALDLLLNDQISLVTITGRAGTGKTLLSLVAGLIKTQDELKYKKLLIARPVIPMGRDLGFLPGDKDDKMRPWMQPIYDNLEFLFHNRNGNLDDVLAGMKNIQVEPLTYIRGRSIPQQFIIIDEAQNLSKHEVKTIISRVGEASKIVLVGDPEQIDNPYLDSFNNGLTFVVEKFKEESIAGHITLQKGERSSLAQLAADLL